MKRLFSLVSTAPLALGLLTLAALGGCGDDCKSAIDCQSGEVCLLGVCTASEAQYRTCGSDSECNEGTQSNLFECVAGKCLVRNVPPPPPPPPMDAGTDAGMDAGTSSIADAGN